jgi:PAS domain S-box-containing protein
MTSSRFPFDRWLDHFLPPAMRQDSEGTRRGRILVGTALSLTLLVAIGLTLRWLLAPLETGVIAVSLVSLATFLAALQIFRGGTARTPGYLILGGLYLLVVGPGAFAAGLDTPALMIAPLIPMVGTSLLGPGTGFRTLLVLLPTLGAFILLHHWGYFQTGSALFGPAGSEIRGVILGLIVVLAAILSEASERQRIRAEQRSQRSQTSYRHLFEQTKHIVAVTTPEGRLVDINQAGIDFYGAATREQLMARDITKSYADAAQRHRLLERLESDGFVKNYTTEHRTATGDLRTVEGTTSTIRGEDGTIEYLLAILTDVTDKQRTEAEREALVAELAAKNAELERFTGAVSHDLKGPLTTIRGYAGLIRHASRQQQPEQVRALSEQLDRGIERMARMIDDLLRLSQIGSRAVQRQEIDVRRVTSEAIDLLQGQITATESRVEVAPDLPPVTGDPALLRIIFQNLIENAIKFSAHRTRPTVHIGYRPTVLREDRNQTATFTVTDNGRGIEPQDRERIFVLFERLHEDNDGSGIGLASVQQAVELQGGTVWVESDGAEKGSTFCFTLPLPVEPT